MGIFSLCTHHPCNISNLIVWDTYGRERIKMQQKYKKGTILELYVWAIKIFNATNFVENRKIATKLIIKWKKRTIFTGAVDYVRWRASNSHNMHCSWNCHMRGYIYNTYIDTNERKRFFCRWYNEESFQSFNCNRLILCKLITLIPHLCNNHRSHFFPID